MQVQTPKLSLLLILSHIPDFLLDKLCAAVYGLTGDWEEQSRGRKNTEPRQNSERTQQSNDKEAQIVESCVEADPTTRPQTRFVTLRSALSSST